MENIMMLIKEKIQHVSAKNVAVKILLTAVAGLMTQVVASYLLTLILDGFFPETASQYASSVSVLLIITPYMLFRVCVLFPVIEELVFRLGILGLLKRWMPFFAANTLQALLFGIYHGNLVQGIYAFLLGLLIGYIYRIAGGVLYTIVFHMFINLAGMFIEEVIPAGTSVMTQTVLALLALTAVSAMILVLRRMNINKEL